MQAIKTPTGVAGSTGNLDLTNINSTLDKIQQELIDLNKYVKEYDGVVDTFKQELGHISLDLDEARLASVKNGANREGSGSQPNAFTDPNLLVAAGVTRFGVLIISIYLVQILINLYRYNTRLASFYRAQADGLVLLELDAKVVEGFQAQFLPHVDYGKTPSTIPERIADAVAGGASGCVAGESERGG